MLGICINLSQKNQEYLHTTYLPSVQVNTCENPHSRTMRSHSARVPISYFSVISDCFIITALFLGS